MNDVTFFRLFRAVLFLIIIVDRMLGINFTTAPAQENE